MSQETEVTKETIAVALSKIYAQLLNNQEPLGKKFEEIMKSNAWDIYEEG